MGKEFFSVAFSGLNELVNWKLTSASIVLCIFAVKCYGHQTGLLFYKRWITTSCWISNSLACCYFVPSSGVIYCGYGICYIIFCSDFSLGSATAVAVLSLISGPIISTVLGASWLYAANIRFCAWTHSSMTILLKNFKVKVMSSMRYKIMQKFFTNVT